MIARTCFLFLLCASPLTAQQLVGWRTDGTGRYPKADPPIKWSTEKNVVWKTKMPNFSVATPIILGDKIFTTSDPTSLICVNKADGAILWEKKCSVDEIPWTAEEKETLKAERAQAQVWDKARQVLDKEANVLEKRIREDKTLAKELRKQIDSLRRQANELRVKRASLKLLMKASPAPRDGTAGYSQCTPVSNGKQIFAAFGNGLVACYDLDGTRRWLKLMEHSTAAYGHGSSPTLAGDKLIVHYADLVALNIKDGSESWRLKLNPLHGTCIPTRIGDTDVILSPMGLMVRVADGAVLAKNLGQNGDNAPILHDGVAYFVNGNTRAVKLPDSPTGEPQPLWKVNLKGGDYWFSSPVYHGGLIYAINGSRNYSVVDAKTGKLVYADRLDVEGRIYPSICFAGKYVYVSSDNGTTIVLEPGREYKEIARNSLETFRSTPIFEGRRMYVRTQKHLWCIGQ
ncbi:MAG: PQQ-binding-like beta-propeller repeat protein [Planctomycetes bacterium]|nr:PQQ-binding-like beta-propeller repeat protein [Planctomycetota bacterium]